MDTSRKLKVVAALFPEKDEITWDRSGGISAGALVTEAEEENAARGIKCGKAPGRDGVKPEALKVTLLLRPDWAARVFDAALQRS